MANDFTAFLKILWRLVEKVIDITTYVICTCLLVLACVLPWRLVHVCAFMQQRIRIGDLGEYRFLCIYHFACTIADIVCVPLGLLGALVPTRTYAYFADTYAYFADAEDIEDDAWNSELRLMWFKLFWGALFDAMFLVWCLPSFIIPTRFLAFIRSITRNNMLREKENSFQCANARCEWFFHPFIAIAEVVTAFFLILSLVTVIRSCITIRDARQAWNKAHNWEEHLLFNPDLCSGIVKNGLSLVVDLFFLPLVLLLALTVVRFQPVWAALSRGLDWETRWIIFEQFCLLLLDLIFLVPLGITLLTWYRSYPVREALHKEYMRQTSLETPLIPTHRDPSHGHWCILVVEAICTMLMDVSCLALLVPIALLTPYRLNTIKVQFMRACGTHSQRHQSWEFHETVFHEFGQSLLDLPFLVGGILVLCSIYRADQILRLCRRDAGNAAHRREAVGMAVGALICDILMLFPLSIIAVTVYRLPALVLSFKVKCSRPLDNEPEMTPLELNVIAPQPRGKPGFRVRASKSPNLCGLSSLRLQVIGDSFWKAVEQCKGVTIARIGQAMLPISLSDPRNVDCSSIKHGQDISELEVVLDTAVGHATVVNFLKSLPGSTELVLQLEGKEKKNGKDLRDTVLLSVPLRIGACLSAVCSPGGLLPTKAILDEASRVEAVASVGHELFRDIWKWLVLIEFQRLIEDFLHLCLFVLLIVFPWRLMHALEQIFEPTARRNMRMVQHTLGAVHLWDRICDEVADRLEPCSNKYVKAAAVSDEVIYHRGDRYKASRAFRTDDGLEGCIAFCCCIVCPCCPNYSSEEDASDFDERLSRSSLETFGRHIRCMDGMLDWVGASLADSYDSWPAGDAWSSLRLSLDANEKARMENFYWNLLLSKAHLIFFSCKREGKVVPEEMHCCVIERIRARAEACIERREVMKEQIKKKYTAQASAARKVWGCEMKSQKERRSIVVQQLLQGLTDVLALPLLCLLVLTFYRLPGLCAQLRCVGLDVRHIKHVLASETVKLLYDMFLLLQFLVLGGLLTVTVVKFPDFIAGLRPARGLRSNRDWAVAMLHELCVGLCELLLLLTAWKTYKVLVYALALAIFTPATFLSSTVPKLCGHHSIFGMTCLAWVTLLAANFKCPGKWYVNAVLALISLSFLGLCTKRANGWSKPREGDWWSPVLRCTLPNLIALSTMAVETFSFCWMAVNLESMHDNQKEQAFATRCAKWAVLGSLLLTTITVVSDDEDQQDIVKNDAWRCVTALLHETFFMPVVITLIPLTLNSYQMSTLVSYFVTMALLNDTTWDVSVQREALLDIRYVDFFGSGKRLIFVVAYIAATFGANSAFLISTLFFFIWAFAWFWLGGASMPWMLIWHMGIAVAALAAVISGWQAAAVVWAVTAVWAAAYAYLDALRRHRALEASRLPAALEKLRCIQARLSLWGDVNQVPVRLNTTPRGAAEQLLELESRLPCECLRWDFLRSRLQWRDDLANVPSYEAVFQLLLQLESAIAIPPTRLRLQLLLGKVRIPGRRLGLPQQVAALVVSFCISDGWAKILLQAPQLPKLGPGLINAIYQRSLTESDRSGLKALYTEPMPAS